MFKPLLIVILTLFVNSPFAGPASQIIGPPPIVIDVGVKTNPTGPNLSNNSYITYTISVTESNNISTSGIIEFARPDNLMYWSVWVTGTDCGFGWNQDKLYCSFYVDDSQPVQSIVLNLVRPNNYDFKCFTATIYWVNDQNYDTDPDNEQVKICPNLRYYFFPNTVKQSSSDW